MTTARPGQTPAAAMVFASAATSLRMSFAIFVPSRIRAGIIYFPEILSYGVRGISPRTHRDTERAPVPVFRYLLFSVSPWWTAFGYNARHDCQRLAGNSGLSGVQAGARVPGES